MGGLLDALQGGGSDAIRQSTSLTTAYLLEQNRKFEAYIRDRVAVLEARVAGQQQARPSTPDQERHDPGWSATGDDLSGEGDEVVVEPAPPAMTMRPRTDVVSFDGLLEDEEEIEAKAPPPAILDEMPAPDGQLPDWTALWGVVAGVETTALPGNEPVEMEEAASGVAADLVDEPDVETAALPGNEPVEMEEAASGAEASPVEEPDVETVAPPDNEPVEMEETAIDAEASPVEEPVAETVAPSGNEPVEMEEAAIDAEASPVEEPDVEIVAPPGGEADDDLFSGPGWLVGEVQAPDVPVPQGCPPITGGVLGLTAALPAPQGPPGKDRPEAPVASKASATPPLVTTSAPPTTSPQSPADDGEGGDGQWDTSLSPGQAGEWA